MNTSKPYEILIESDAPAWVSIVPVVGLVVFSIFIVYIFYLLYLITMNLRKNLKNKN